MNPFQSLLSNLLLSAESHPGQKVTARLSNDLKVDCMLKDGKTFVQISRSSMWPTLQDWAAIQRDWPQPFSLQPKRAQQKGRYYFFTSYLM